MGKGLLSRTLIGTTLIIFAQPVSADNVINDDLIVQFSTCVGQDCVDGKTLGLQLFV